jgi:hypothetical protein
MHKESERFVTMDAGTILSAYQIPGNISGDKTMTVPGNEPGTKADYFAAWLSLLLSFQDTLGRLSEQDREETETVEPGLLPEKDVVSEVFYPLGVIPGILPQSPSLDSVQPAPGENIPNMLVCQESPPADSAQIREELPQGSGKDMTIHRLEAELAMPEQGQGIKDKGMAHQLPPIGRDLTEPELAFGLKELLPGAGKERDTLLQKADLRSGSGEGFYETEQKAVHGDKVSELLKELSGEVKREYALTGKDNLRQGGAVSEKDRISDTETAMESSGVKGSGVYEKNENSFSSEEIIPDVRYKETITGRNFDFKQTEIPDKAQIWARVIDFIKEVPLSSAMEGRSVQPAPGENIPNMLVCQESPPADSAQIREELPQGSGKDMTIHRLEAELAMPEQGQGIKDKGMAHQLPPIGRDLTEPELAFGLKELLPGAGKERDTLLQKADLRSGSGEGFYETEQKAVHGDKVSELLKELSGEVKREYALTGKDNLRQGGAVSEKDRISDTETAMESSGVKGSGVYEKNENSFSSEEIIPDVRYKETITGRNFDFKQTEIPDKAQIWARVIDFIKEVPLSSAMEGRSVQPAPGENIPNMLVCQESPPADSAR